MKEDKTIPEEELKKISGGYFPEEVGDPVIIPPGIVSYKVCDKCGGVMTPVKIRTVNGKQRNVPREYVCTECGARTEILVVFN